MVLFLSIINVNLNLNDRTPSADSAHLSKPERLSGANAAASDGFAERKFKTSLPRLRSYIPPWSVPLTRPSVVSVACCVSFTYCSCSSETTSSDRKSPHVPQPLCVVTSPPSGSTQSLQDKTHLETTRERSVWVSVQTNESNIYSSAVLMCKFKALVLCLGVFLPCCFLPLVTGCFPD